jgi:thiol-disulfide isomerase/thioredoxin
VDKRLFHRRQLLWYFGLGIAGAGTAATVLHRHSTVNSAERSADQLPTAGDSQSTKANLELPASMSLPEFQGISEWLNSEALTVADLKGSVVLVQFWTFACINCQRTLPYITEWHRQYAAQGLKVVGIHTPEFAFERELSNVEAALAEYQITYPVPIDNEFATWKAYSNRFWPHLFLADREGVIRYDHIGEGAYDETAQAIRQLLA